MSRFERVMLYVVSAVVFGGVVASQVGLPRRSTPDGIVHAADIDDNHPLDVIRRGVHFARDARIAAEERALRLQRAPLRMGELQGVIGFCRKTYLDEFSRAQKLERSSAPGDRTRAKAAYTRAGEFDKLEQMLRRLYGTEAQRLIKEYESNVKDVRVVSERAGSWKSIEEALRYAYMAQASKLKAQGMQ